MTDDVKAVVERLTGAASDDEAHWSMDPDAPPAVDVRVDDLRTLLSAHRKMVEAVNLLRRIREGLWIQPQHWNIHDRPRVHELLAEIDAAISGSPDNAR